jgi:hypothetical protein
VGQLVLSTFNVKSPAPANWDTTFELARTSNANIFNGGGGGIVITAYTWLGSWKVYRTVLAFDYTINKLPAGSVITSIITNITNASNGAFSHDWQVVFVSGTGCIGVAANDFITLFGKTTSFASIPIDSFTGNFDQSINATGLVDLVAQLTNNPNYVYLGVRCSRDINDVQPPSGNDGAVAQNVTLTINYTLVPSPKLVGSPLSGGAYRVSRRLL